MVSEPEPKGNALPPPPDIQIYPAPGIAQCAFYIRRSFDVFTVYREQDITNLKPDASPELALRRDNHTGQGEREAEARNDRGIHSRHFQPR
jgi:hypothetical protein